MDKDQKTGETFHTLRQIEICSRDGSGWTVTFDLAGVSVVCMGSTAADALAKAARYFDASAVNDCRQGAQDKPTGACQGRSASHQSGSPGADTSGERQE